MFISDASNLGASLDLDILTYFAQNNIPFLMECCTKTELDIDIGHIALRKV